MTTHPCLTCGACCAFFRVSFYSTERDQDRLQVPRELTVQIDSKESVMEGTNQIQSPRCVALTGEVAKDAHCSIYENRPSPCRKFEASYTYGLKEPRCDEARAAFGMPPLRLQDYDGFRNRDNYQL